jgi:hypothetical protein
VTRALRAAAWTACASSVAASALACPQCAGRPGAGPGLYVAMAAVVTLPYLVAAVVIPAIRRGPPSGRGLEP